MDQKSCQLPPFTLLSRLKPAGAGLPHVHGEEVDAGQGWGRVDVPGAHCQDTAHLTGDSCDQGEDELGWNSCSRPVLDQSPLAREAQPD